MSNIRTCLDCKHMTADEGFYGTDVTPADGISYVCRKKRWGYTSPDDKRQMKVNLVDAAQGCPDFKEEV